MFIALSFSSSAYNLRAVHKSDFPQREQRLLLAHRPIEAQWR